MHEAINVYVAGTDPVSSLCPPPTSTDVPLASIAADWTEIQRVILQGRMSLNRSIFPSAESFLSSNLWHISSRSRVNKSARCWLLNGRLWGLSSGPHPNSHIRLAVSWCSTWGSPSLGLGLFSYTQVSCCLATPIGNHSIVQKKADFSKALSVEVSLM